MKSEDVFNKSPDHKTQNRESVLREGQEDCAFDGAMLTLVPITDAAHLIHGPSGCINNCWGNRSSLSSNSILYKARFSTDMDENDIIFGGAKKLYNAIIETQRRYKPAAVFVYSTCVSALIGDDLNGACTDAAVQTGTPIIPVDCPGFVGRKNRGMRIAGEALLEHVIGTAEPDFTTPYDINLIGESNIAAMWNILPLFEKLGIRVLSKITGDTRYKEVCYAHRAKLNVITSSIALLKMAKKMEERFGIPYIQECFYGIENINQSLRNIAAKLGDSDLQERTEKFIALETSALEEKLAFYRTSVQGKRIVIDTQELKSWSIISAAQKLGIEVIPISAVKSSQEDKARIQKLLGKDSIILQQNTPEEILQIIHENKADMLITGERYQYTSVKGEIPSLDIKAEQNHSNAGYAGILEAAQKLYATLTSPVWKLVHKPAPWENR
ncbi:MAG: nitrogenase iron-molybdenum cofactor biosynthesis protein NifE [Brasilonema octagenarum HA4186-MV1]|jgi:nitrogenase molybdenum-cofactor synthesis protein NifE|nr:nitrogenase iron-molybdenum cofactor biosynthesis protein NifE [Brasilonema octagenarum HA4186-MV1]